MIESIRRLLPEEKTAQPMDTAAFLAPIWPTLHDAADRMDRMLVMQGQALHEQNRHKVVRSLQDVEFRVFSQFGDDGIIMYLVEQLQIPEHLQVFVEFGVQDYRESNTRFLLMAQNWSGLVMDGDEGSIRFIQTDSISWRNELKSQCSWVTKENINDEIRKSGISGEIGLLHVDLDGNDYWIWKEIDVVSPWIVIMEYNAVFGGERAVTVPYDEKFDRGQAHSCMQYWGVSLKGLVLLAEEKGYVWVGCDRAGNNAYFVRKDRVQPVEHLVVSRRFIASKFRDSRDAEGKLNFLTGTERLKAIESKEIWDLEVGKLISCKELITGV